MNSNSNIIKRFSIGVVMLSMFCVAGNIHAEEGRDSYRKLVYRWHQQRDDTVKRIVHSWLRGATPDSLKSDILQVINLDVRLANEDVPLYIPALRDPNDLNMSVADLVHQYLKRLDVIVDTGEFFRGKTFRVLRQENSIVGKSGKSAPKMAFQKWE